VFNTDARGLPGNDDAGSLGAYLVWMMSGLVPIAGQSVYLILPPFFPQVQWTIPNSRIITHHMSPENQFIHSVIVNGHPVPTLRTVEKANSPRLVAQELDFA
jgi:putative alpha-1,2-mannosidase